MTLPPRLFCDTAFFFASIEPTDRKHQRARELNEDIVASRSELFTTEDVVSETVTLLRYRSSFEGAIAFLDEIKPTLHIVPYDESVRAEAENIFRFLSKEHQVSYCDAVSYVVITTLLEHMPCLTFDADFRRMGLTVID